MSVSFLNSSRHDRPFYGFLQLDPRLFSHPVAISPDNQRVAIASPRGIHVKSLAP
jgi:hypothetical protein